MALFLFSLIGLPLTGGFMGKLFLFMGALGVPPMTQEGAPPDSWNRFTVLALIGAINAAIGAWYYLRVITVMFLRSPIKPLARIQAWPGLASLLGCAILTLVLGIWPASVWDRAKAAIWPASSASTLRAQH
jgi:NADH-quinone oxidoreductase subunit N